MQHQTVLVEHKPQNVNGRNGAFTIHKFRGQDGLWYESSKQDIANIAYALFQNGQPAFIDFEAVVNGQYTNNRINSIQAAGANGAPMANGVLPAAVTPAVPPTSAPAQAPTQASGPSYRNESSPNEAGRIARAVAVEHLPEYVKMGVFEAPTTLGQLGDQLAMLARYVFEGSRPGAATQGAVSSGAGGGEQTGAPQAVPPAQQAPVAAPPAEAPAQAPTAAPAAVATADDDIPF